MQLIDGPPESHLDVVLLNSRVHADVHHWLGSRRIYKIDCSALKDVAISPEDQITAVQVYAPENDRLGCGATHTKIGCALQA